MALVYILVVGAVGYACRNFAEEEIAAVTTVEMRTVVIQAFVADIAEVVTADLSMVVVLIVAADIVVPDIAVAGIGK